VSGALKRGERDNNPGNLRRNATSWLGLLPLSECSEKVFCTFDTPVNGIRALCKVLLSYQRIDGCNTLARVVDRYAPKTENDTDAYLADVVARTGIGAGEAIDLNHPGELANIARAIIVHENGRCIYDADTINKAVTFALET
jgi:hypothetical protein